MRVHGNALDAYSRVAIGPVGTSKAAGLPAAANAGSEAAEISVSEEARALAAQASSSSNQTSVDETKVATLKNRIDTGTYGVNSQTLAARLLDIIG